VFRIGCVNDPTQRKERDKFGSLRHGTASRIDRLDSASILYSRKPCHGVDTLGKDVVDIVIVIVVFIFVVVSLGP
jgi:hypothetical protein